MGRVGMQKGRQKGEGIDRSVARNPFLWVYPVQAKPVQAKRSVRPAPHGNAPLPE